MFRLWQHRHTSRLWSCFHQQRPPLLPLKCQHLSPAWQHLFLPWQLVHRVRRNALCCSSHPRVSERNRNPAESSSSATRPTTTTAWMRWALHPAHCTSRKTGSTRACRSTSPYPAPHPYLPLTAPRPCTTLKEQKPDLRTVRMSRVEAALKAAAQRVRQRKSAWPRTHRSSYRTLGSPAWLCWGWSW